MSAEQRVRTLIGAADPVRAEPAPAPRLPAAVLIARAESAGPPMAHRWGRATTPRAVLGSPLARRAVLVGGAAAAAAVAYSFTNSSNGSGPAGPPDAGSTPLPASPSGGAAPGTGRVLVPIAYQFDQNPPPAADRLRKLARRLVDAPYEQHTGRYAVHRVKTWGHAVQVSEEGYVMGHAEEDQSWRLPDGSVFRRVTPMPPEFPDQKSRDFWSSTPGFQEVRPPYEETDPADPEREPLPTDRTGLARWLKAGYGGGAVAKQVSTAYSQYVLPKQSRAWVLEIVAAEPGFVWRGRVADRAGRTGVAVTIDERAHDQRSLLIFDQTTGDLLGHELVTLGSIDISFYLLVLDTDRADSIG